MLPWLIRVNHDCLCTHFAGVNCCFTIAAYESKTSITETISEVNLKMSLSNVLDREDRAAMCARIFMWQSVAFVGCETCAPLSHEVNVNNNRWNCLFRLSLLTKAPRELALAINGAVCSALSEVPVPMLTRDGSARCGLSIFDTMWPCA